MIRGCCLPDAIKDIERPLGRDPARRGPSAGRGRLDRGTAVAVVAALVVTGVSGAIALREQPLRDPQAVAIATPAETPAAEVAAVAQPPAGPKPDTASKPGGPQIIRVEPKSDGGGGGIVIRDPSAVGQDLRIAHLPDKALIEQSEAGPLPIRAADGRRPFDAYARPWSGARGARVAIVIGGLAVSQTGTQAAIAKLPPEVTLAFASGGNSIGRWMEEGRRRGHEIVMQMPMEPFDYPGVDPGRNTLTVSATPEENLDSLRRVLARTTNYTSVMNYMGARFTADADAMAPIMAELARRGLGYVDDGSSARSIAPELAAQDGVPLAVADAQIDLQQERGAILKKLDQLEATARAKGFAIGTGSAFDVTVEAVATWVNEAKMRGIEIVPVSAVAADPQRR